jgi:formylglycine-generating enzyme required for sulfatase activity
VAEWCRDRYVPYDREVAPGDGERHSGDEPGRVVRGGAADDPPGPARCAFRRGETPDSRHQLVGVRPARAIDSL